MSSPPPQMSFEGLLGQTTSQILSSPIHSSFAQYDQTSPYTTIRKTPTDHRVRARMRIEGGGFLVSPLVTDASRTTGTTIMTSNPMHSSGLSFIARTGVQDSAVQIADPTVQPDWESMDMGALGILPSDGMDMSSFNEHAMAYGSPYKAQLHGSQAHTPQPVDVTPCQSPVAPSAPSSAKKVRAVSGLGTPTGVQRSAKRIRQATYDANSMPVSPSAARRKSDTANSLTTSIPLSRTLSSSSYLNPPQFVQDRVVSNTSVMTASTSYETVGSPNMAMYGQEYHIQPSTSLPELVGSQHPSPNMSLGGRSPLSPPQQQATVFYTSPENQQGDFQDNQDHSLLGGISQMLSRPNSSSMASISSFPGAQSYRQGTLSTIVETPQVPQEQMQFPQYPNQHGMSSQPQFQPVDYPPVPGMSMGYAGSQQMDIHAWSAQTYANQPSFQQFYGYSQPPQLPPGPQRHASTSVLSYQPPTDQVRVFPNVPRSVSAPYIQTVSSMPSMADLAPSLSAGGIFGPGPSSQMGSAALDFDSQPPLPPYRRGVTSSPDTPRKRQTFPAVGKRLRPGPKPKAKTPKKGSCASSPELGQGTLDPSVLGGGGSSSMPMVDDELNNADEENEHDEDEEEPSSKLALVFGPDLSSIPIKPQLLAGSQPQLVIQPPRAALTLDGHSASGLPRTFLEKLYTTFLTLDGSMTGQPVKRFKCLIEGCERHFPRKSAIHSHIQTHLEDKPFVCNADDWYVFWSRCIICMTDGLVTRHL